MSKQSDKPRQDCLGRFPIKLLMGDGLHQSLEHGPPLGRLESAGPDSRYQATEDRIGFRQVLKNHFRHNSKKLKTPPALNTRIIGQLLSKISPSLSEQCA